MDMETEELLNEEVDSEDSEDNEEALEMEVINLENKIAENEFSYQPYLDLIKVLKTLVDLDRLRHARKRMATRFPLSPDLWIDWLHDEINLATSLEEKEQIVELFQTAVKDYLSVNVWLQYALYMISFEKEKNSKNPSAIRNIFENALTAAGLHVTEGSMLWNAYIEYEKSILSELPRSNEEYVNQVKRIANLYKRQLSCPLQNMEATYNVFSEWLDRSSRECSEPIIDLKIVNGIYMKAKEKLDKILPFEEKWHSNQENVMEVLREYLDHEKSKEGLPVRVQCLYERILCENCLNDEIWSEYVQYVDGVLHNAEVVLNVCKRAVRNCPWCCKLYQLYITCSEKYGVPQKSITSIVEEAFSSGMQIASDFRDVWMTYLEYLRRNFDSSENKEEEEKRLQDLRAAFSKAVEFVEQLSDADPEFTLAQYWARVEAIYCKNMEKSRELWNGILANENCKTAEMWLEYIHLERTFGDSKHIRKLFPRALQGTRDDPERIGKAWLNYERDEGTLESYENCTKKISMKMKEITERRQREEEKMAAAAAATAYDTSLYLPKKRSKRKFGNEEETREKTQVVEPFGNGDNRKVTGYKRKQTDFKEDTSPAKKNKQNELEERETEAVEETQEEFVKKLLEETKKQHGETVVHEPAKDHRTVFVSNLDFSTEEQTIREVFSSCGQITDLRLVRDFKGRSKGYCYVEFEKAKQAQAALEKDRELISGRPMFVSKCDPDRETRASGFKYSSKMEKNKLFVRGLPFSATVDDLKTLFSKYGALKDVRLVTYRNGHSKGLAYVEFFDEASAAQAVLSTDGTTMEGKQISVAISNPPERKTEGLKSSKPIISLGGGPKEMGPRGKSKTQISFLPRAVSLNKPAVATESMANLTLASPLPPNENKNLNNSDFRKLLG